MRTTTPRLRRILRAIAVVAASTLCVAAASAQVLAQGATYEGQPAIARVSAYIFMDMRPEYMPEAFVRTFKEKFAQELTRSGVPSRQVWFSETQAGRDLIADPKAYTAARITSIPVGRTVHESLAADREFQPSHWLIVAPTEWTRPGDGAVMTQRWEFKDTRTGYINWSVYSVSHALWKAMDPADAQQAATDFVAGMVAEMRRCKVLAEPKD